MNGHHIAVVILNYNSEIDLQICTEQLLQQTNVRFTTILVDNASHPESLIKIKLWLNSCRPETIIGTKNEVMTWVGQYPENASVSGRVYLITHDENRGYSAGNNIGIHLAETLGADAVLIANPDIRIENPNYLYELSELLFSDERNYIAASRIVGLDGKDQNPLREPGFWEELFWFRVLLSWLLEPTNYVLSVNGNKPLIVPKVSGCCLMIRMSFLKRINYLDEGVFLYCEEPILSAQVRSLEGQIAFLPSLIAVHAHVRNEKGNSSRRMLNFIKSRGYYLRNYSGYSSIHQMLLIASYQLLAVIHKLQAEIVEHLSHHNRKK